MSAGEETAKMQYSYQERKGASTVGCELYLQGWLQGDWIQSSNKGLVHRAMQVPEPSSSHWLIPHSEKEFAEDNV